MLRLLFTSRRWWLKNPLIMLNLMLRFMLMKTRVSLMNLMMEIWKKLILLILMWKNLQKYLSPKPMALAMLKG
jgi:hypothetical protein